MAAPLPKISISLRHIELKNISDLRSEVLGLFGNNMTADHMYSRHYVRENFAKY